MADLKIACTDKNHHHHMCILKDTLKASELAGISDKPVVECGICGAKANSADNVCTPVKVWEVGQLS